MYETFYNNFVQICIRAFLTNLGLDSRAAQNELF